MIPAQIDIQTIFFLLFSANLIMAVLLIFYGISTQFDKYLIYYISGKILQIFSIIIFNFNGVYHFHFILAVGGSSSFLGFSLETYCLIFVGKNIVKKFTNIYFAIMILVIIIFPFLSLFDALSTFMKIAPSIVSTILLLITGIALLFYNNETKLRKALGVFFLVMTFPHLLLFFINYFKEKAYYFSIEPSYTQTVFFLFSFMQIIISTIAYLLMHRETAYRELKDAATKDFLTGIFNRREFMLLSTMLFNLMLRQKSNFSILMLDLDHFKSINDKFGHQTGDRVIKHFAKSVELYIRKQDIFARYGGEEFIIFLPDTEKKEAFSIAERIRKRILRGGIPEAHIPQYTVSIGCSSITPDENTVLENVIAFADKALYEAKQKGRNKVVGHILKN
jgi:diguanylate cyclase (GGDEF)-like protein